MKEIIISEREASQRLDKFLGKYMNQAPKSFFYKMLRKKNIVLNGKKASGSEKLMPGDSVKLFLANETIEKFTQIKEVDIPKPEKERLEIVYEDKNVLLINKPVGMLSQKAGSSDLSLVEYITDYLLDSGQLKKEDLRIFRPGVCNRLDRNTSGLVAAGKSLPGLQQLSLAFKERRLRKYYRCLVLGEVKKKQYIKGYLRKDEKKNRVKILKERQEGTAEIETEYRPVSTNGLCTLLEVHLITGKPHQIRAHLASVNHPILGDFKYGNSEANQKLKKEFGLTSQLLHAYRLEFPEMKGELENLSGQVFLAKPPELFEHICRRCVGTGSEE